METRENVSQFTIVMLKPAFPSSGIITSLVMWQRNGNDGQLSALLLSAGEESFSHKLLRKFVKPPAGHSSVSRDFWTCSYCGAHLLHGKDWVHYDLGLYLVFL